jgi:hypothetical protein
VFEGHRLPSTASRWDVRWVSGRRNTIYIVYIAWRLRQCFAVCGKCSSFFGRVVRCQRVPVFEGHRLPSTESQ